MHSRRLIVTFLWLMLVTAAWGQDADSWQMISVPGYWEEQQDPAGDDHDGYAWYRCFVQIPAAWKGKPVTLQLGRIDDCDETYLNGQLVGQSGTVSPYQSASAEPREYALPPEHIHYGHANLLAVRVYDGGGAGGFAAGPVRLAVDQQIVRLDGRWQFRQDDHPRFAHWPEGLDREAADRLALAFARLSDSVLGRHVQFQPLSGTAPLTMQGDLASQLVEGVDRFLSRKLQDSVQARAKHWQRDFNSRSAYEQSVQPNRERLAYILGMQDPRAADVQMQLVTTVDRSSLVGRGPGYTIHQVRWDAVGPIQGEGLLLMPQQTPIARVVALPTAGQSPEQLCGLAEGVPPEAQFARRLVEQGCLVVVPVLIDRQPGQFPGVRDHQLPNREFLYRSAYELGRHLIGYEVQKVLAAVDWFERQGAGDLAVPPAEQPPVKDPGEQPAEAPTETVEAARRQAAPGQRIPIGVFGYGDGGMLALYAAALDQRIDAAVVSGYINDRTTIWQQPLDRNVFGLLEQFGDAELMTLVAPRILIVEASRHPDYELPAGTGAGPARIVTPDLQTVESEVSRARQLLEGWADAAETIQLTGTSEGLAGQDATLSLFGRALVGDRPLAEAGPLPETGPRAVDESQRMARLLRQIDQHTQTVLRESPYVRQQFMSRLDTSSLSAFTSSQQWYRDYFRDEVIGHFSDPRLPANPRTRQIDERGNVAYYEVVLDVFPDVIAYGILCVPLDLPPDERRPVVVCQHGLEGRPQSVIGNQDYRYYKAFATELAERGFVTFAPQNLYIFGDRFRTLQRKANPLKKTLFSIIVPQHQQIVDWLQSLSFVDPERIAFYGLSYGGKTAMRVPPLVTDYCLSICSADFNEWVDKNASTRNPRSYVWTGEYEIFEWDLGSTFNYAEMAALIAPRPFMVERGHGDGVADDWTVAWEFAKVRLLYQAGLKLPERCEIEWFDGPHAINGQGTYRFLHRHLNWPEPASRP